jgi:crossover junction endodeoxyribonuclease RuvC
MIYIGIDPGLNGAVAFINEDVLGNCKDTDGSGLLVEVFDTPTLEVDSSGKVRNKYNTAAMADLLAPYLEIPPYQRGRSLVILESVHSMPKQGVASSFTFGEGLGMWKGIIAAYRLPLELPSPQRWKKEMMADMGKDKDASRLRAIQLFPVVANRLDRKKDDGRAEALLLAEYGRRLRKVA